MKVRTEFLTFVLRKGCKILILIKRQKKSTNPEEDLTDGVILNEDIFDDEDLWSGFSGYEDTDDEIISDDNYHIFKNKYPIKLTKKIIIFDQVKSLP